MRNIPYTAGHFPYHSMVPLYKQERQRQLWQFFNSGFIVLPTKYYREPTPRQLLAKIVNSRSYQKLDAAIREREEAAQSVKDWYLNRAVVYISSFILIVGTSGIVKYLQILTISIHTFLYY